VLPDVWAAFLVACGATLDTASRCLVVYDGEVHDFLNSGDLCVSCPVTFLSEWSSSRRNLCLDPRVDADDGGICGCRFLLEGIVMDSLF
jgi:hypothetical protein